MAYFLLNGFSHPAPLTLSVQSPGPSCDPQKPAARHPLYQLLSLVLLRNSLFLTIVHKLRIKIKIMVLRALQLSLIGVSLEPRSPYM